MKCAFLTVYFDSVHSNDYLTPLITLYDWVLIPMGLFRTKNKQKEANNTESKHLKGILFLSPIWMRNRIYPWVLFHPSIHSSIDRWTVSWSYTERPHHRSSDGETRCLATKSPIYPPRAIVSDQFIPAHLSVQHATILMTPILWRWFLISCSSTSSFCLAVEFRFSFFVVAWIGTSKTLWRFVNHSQHH